jgi:putative endonuclease
MDRANIIAEPSQALKSSSSSSSEPYWAHSRGLESEEFVKDHYRKKNYKLKAQRVRTPFAEVDLIFESPAKELLMVEVKSVNIADFAAFRISQKQKQRLIRAMIFLAEKFARPVEVHWAFVTGDGEITIIEDISN